MCLLSVARFTTLLIKNRLTVITITKHISGPGRQYMFTNSKLAQSVKLACAFGAVSSLGFAAPALAQEAGADTSAIVAEKNRLRDITKLADSATTLDELKNLEAL